MYKLLKRSLYGLAQSLEQGGHPGLGRIARGPMEGLRLYRQYRDAARRESARRALRREGRWVSYLGPAWDAGEFALRRNWSREARGRDARRDLERFFEVRHGGGGCRAVALSSGRTALRLGLRILKESMPERREVILPSYCCLGVLEPVLAEGLRPVLVDVGEDLNISPASISEELGEETLAVIGAHLCGLEMTGLDQMRREVEQCGAVFIEDVCQALGELGGRPPLGVGARMAVYSLGLGKTLCATAGGVLVLGEGEALSAALLESLGEETASSAPARFDWLRETCLNEQLFMDSRRLRRPDAVFQSAYGWNRMHALDALLGLRQLERMEELSRRLREHGLSLREACEGLPGLRLCQPDAGNLYCKVPVVFETEDLARRTRSGLGCLGVEVEPMYVPLHKRAQGREFARKGLPMSESLEGRVLSLPNRANLNSFQMGYVVESLRGVMSSESSA